MSNVKTQTRGICPCCGNEQAVLNNGRMSKHGYTVQHGWFQGVCSGQMYRPLNESREPTDKLIAKVEAEMVLLAGKVEGLKSGKLVPQFVVRGYSRNRKQIPFAEADQFEKRDAIDSEIRQANYRIRAGKDFVIHMTYLANTIPGTPLRVVELSDGPAPIASGERRVTGSGLVLTCKYVERGRVYYSYGCDGKKMTGWQGLSSWRKLGVAA